MAVITVNQAAVVGANIAYSSIAVGGDTFPNDGKTVLLFHNTGSAVTVTITPQKLIGGLTIQPVSKAVVSGTDVVIGPFDPTIFNTAAGAAVLTYSGGYITTTIAPIAL
jgi:hypothetical protein